MVKIDCTRYFVLNSEIYTEECDNRILFYNTLTGEKIVFSCSSALKKLTSKLQKYQQIALKSGIHQEFDLLLNALATKGFGCFIPNGYFMVKPFIPKTKLKIMEAYSEKCAQNLSKGLKILDYLAEITIYLNSYQYANQQKNIWEQAFQQFVAPAFLPNSRAELDYNLLVEFIKDVADKQININFMGGSVFECIVFDKLIGFLQAETYKFSPVLHLTAQEWLRHIGKIKKLASTVNLHYSIYFADSMDYALTIPSDCNTELVFIVQNEKDLKSAEQYIIKNRIERYFLKPFYNGDNDKFFTKNVFLTEDDIFTETIDWRIIHRNSTLNSNYFGKLTILNTGEVFSDLNTQAIGNLQKDNLKYLIMAALKKRYGWMEIRSRLSTCKECLYKNLCPPVSNYEKVIKKNNLCKVKTYL